MRGFLAPRVPASQGTSDWSEGIYKLVIDKEVKGRSFLVHNDTQRSKRAVPIEQGVVADDYIYPFTSGACTQRWLSTVAGLYLYAYSCVGDDAVSEGAMKARSLQTYEFLSKFRRILEGRQFTGNGEASTNSTRSTTSDLYLAPSR